MCTFFGFCFPPITVGAVPEPLQEQRWIAFCLSGSIRGHSPERNSQGIQYVADVGCLKQFAAALFVGGADFEKQASYPRLWLCLQHSRARVFDSFAAGSKPGRRASK